MQCMRAQTVNCVVTNAGAVNTALSTAVYRHAQIPRSGNDRYYRYMYMRYSGDDRFKRLLTAEKLTSSGM